MRPAAVLYRRQKDGLQIARALCISSSSFVPHPPPVLGTPLTCRRFESPANQLTSFSKKSDPVAEKLNQPESAESLLVIDSGTL